METTVTVERLDDEENSDFLPSQEILRENLKASRKKRAARRTKKYKCRICYELFKDETGLILHEKTHDPDNPYSCSKCQFKTSRRDYLKQHTRKVHNKQNYKEECDICGKKFLFKSLLDKHVRVHTGEKPNKCEVCGKGFNSNYSLNCHRLIHTNEKPFKCAFCDYACRDSSTLRKHQNNHLGIVKRYPCTECKYKYDTNARLQAHIKEAHRGEPVRLICPTCGASYRNKQTLTNHIKAVHEKSMSCVCGICGRRLTNYHNLNAHMKSHLEIRPYKCDYPGCNTKFKEKASLKKHSRKHNPEEQVVCDECGRSFTRKSRLIKHFIQHLPRVKDTECPFCKVCFYNKNYLLKHLRYKHGKRDKYICDLCGFEAYNKPGLVVHLRHIHTTLDTQCHICRKIFKRKANLYIHYRHKHNITFKSNENQPMVVIKQEPIDFEPDLEIDLLDIDKEEPFAGFDVHPNKAQDILLPKTISEAMNSSVEFEEDKYNDAVREINSDVIECKDMERENNANITIATEKQVIKNYDEEDDDKNDILVELDSKKDTLQAKSEPSAKEVDELIHQMMTETDKNYISVGTESKEDTLQAKSRPSAMEVHELIHHMTAETEDKSDISVERDSKEDTLQTESGQTMEVDELIHHMIAETEDKEIEEPTDSKDTTQAESGRRTMQVEEFLQHVMGDTDIQTEENDEESEEYMKIKIKELVEKSNIKNGIRKRQTAYGKKLERIKEEDISKYVFKNIKMSVNEEVIPKKEEKSEKNVKKKKRKKPKRSKEEKKEYKIKKKALDIIKGHKKVQYSRKSKTKLSNYNEDSNEDKTETESKKSKGDSDAVKGNAAFKLIFNSHQCYVCYKLFQTKPELIEHCKEHFDVCNEITLKKCPICPFVTHHDIKRHIRLQHKQNINFSFMRIKDKKHNENGSRYYFDTDNEKIKRLEIIPSVKILNKKASMDLDKRNREIKDKSLLKRKLVRKGKEWIVETEKIDVTDHVVPQMKDKDNYLAKMKLLSVQSKKNKMKMLYPCNTCDKICQNLSALTLHMRRHDPNAKPFKPKVYKHKQGNPDSQKPVLPAKPPVDISNRTAKPKPIVNKHKCDPKLKAFYEKNIRGGDIEFWQFLKIFNKMDRDNINDFKDLETSVDYGVHIDTSISENNNKDEATESSIPINDTSNTDSNKTKSIANRPVKKIKYVRKIQLSKEEYKKRCEIKNKLREKLAKTNS